MMNYVFEKIEQNKTKQFKKTYIKEHLIKHSYCFPYKCTHTYMHMHTHTYMHIHRERDR